MTEVELRSQYLIYQVAEDDIPSDAIGELMNLSIGSRALAVAYIRDHHISLVTIDVRGNDQLGDGTSDLSPDGVAAAGHQGGLPQNDVPENNAAENAAARRECAQAPPPHPADNVAGMPPGVGNDEEIGNGSIGTYSVSSSGGDRGKKQKSRVE
jgi:hypothetical protein